MNTTIPLLALALLITNLTGCKSCECAAPATTSPQPPTTAVDAAKTARLDLAAIGSTIQHFQRNNRGDCPDIADRLVEKDANGNSYYPAENLPLDAYGRDYVYNPGKDGKTWELWFLGKDGKPGGKGADADISAAMVSQDQ